MAATRTAPARAGGRRRLTPLDLLATTLLTIGALAVGGVAALRRRWSDETVGPRLTAVLPGLGATPAASEDPAGSGALGALRRRFGHVRVVGRALEVQQRFGALHGGDLATTVTYRAFVSLFPVLLLAVAAVGIVAGSGSDVAGEIIGGLGLSGETATTVRDAVASASRTSKAVSAIGLLGLLWSALGLVDALQSAHDRVWQVEERGLRGKGVGAVWLGGAAVLSAATAATTAIVGLLPGIFAPVGIALGLLSSFLLWLWTGHLLPNTELPWRAAVPGAVLGAVGLEALKLIGGIYIPRVVTSSSALWGSLGVVFALLAWLSLVSKLAVYAVVLDVVSWERRAGQARVVSAVPAEVGPARRAPG